MSTEIATIDMTQLPATRGDDKMFDDLAKAVDYLQRLQLFSKGKAIDKGLVKPGHYGIVQSKDEIVDLGNCIDVLVLVRRPKAIDMSDTEALVVSHDPESDVFQRIAAQSSVKDSGCMYGPTFLMFERTTRQFLEFFCGSKSNRSECKKIYPYLPLSAADAKAAGQEPHGPIPMTLNSRYVERGSYSWFVPVVSKCSVPFDNLPPMDEIVKAIEKFNSDQPTAEKVEQPANRRAR
jgi:hypothetical protein